MSFKSVDTCDDACLDTNLDTGFQRRVFACLDKVVPLIIRLLLDARVLASAHREVSCLGARGIRVEQHGARYPVGLALPAECIGFDPADLLVLRLAPVLATLCRLK